ncbi:MAG: hypothetical protein RRZ65_06845 [Tannerellaceae bacterium]
MNKKKILSKLLFGAAVVLFAACSNGDEFKEETQDNLPKAVTAAFEKQFPGATNVTWTEKKDYFVASFDLGGTTRADAAPGAVNEAWYTDAGVCGLSELEISQTELEKTYAAVFAALKATPYMAEGYQIDDIDLLQRSANSNDRVIKVEIGKGKLERNLFFTPEGLLVKDVEDIDNNDKDDNLPCPKELTDFVNLHYKDAVIVDFEPDAKTKTFEVEILITQMGVSMEKELTFNEKYEFTGAEIDIEDKALAQLIQKMLTPEQMAAIAKITGENDPNEWDIEITENPAGDITISVENADEKMVPIVVLDKNFQPKK